MAGREHRYEIVVRWTGNRGDGTTGYKSFSRDHEIQCHGKPTVLGSSDPSFRGDADRWNPEELLLASLSACHKLWYLHLCAVSGVVVTAYVDRAEGVMVEEAKTGGRFVKVILRPDVTIAPGSDRTLAEALHEDANRKCFIANSVNFPVAHAPTVRVEEASDPG